MNSEIHLYLWAAYVVLISGVSGHVIRCHAPPVARGKTADVTCYFNRDISLERRDFAVHRYDLKGKFQGDVLSCFWMGNVSVPICEQEDGYHFNKQVNESATFQIKNATEENIGTYVCQVTPAGDDKLESCFFALEEPTQCNWTQHCPEKECEPCRPLLQVVLPVLLIASAVIAVLAVALVITRRRLQELKRTPENPPEKPLFDINDDDNGDGDDSDNESSPLLDGNTLGPPRIHAKHQPGLKGILNGACSEKNINMKMWLIEHGEPVDRHDEVTADTPLQVVCSCGHKSLVTMQNMKESARHFTRKAPVATRAQLRRAYINA